MNARFRPVWVSVALVTVGCGLLAGCGSGDSKLENKNPGNNDLNVVAAFGDSLTAGSDCPCVSYPARLGGLIGKAVYNAGIDGSEALENVGRVQSVIDRYHPAYMLIMYGINDIIQGRNIPGIVGALNQMVSICKQNNVVPVLATYPQPIGPHQIFGFNALALNSGIRSLAGAEGIKCVDLEPEFAGEPGLMMGDGLHPNDAGTQVMALAFADLF